MKNYLISEAIGDIAGPMAYAYYKSMSDALVELRDEKSSCPW